MQVSEHNGITNTEEKNATWAKKRPLCNWFFVFCDSYVEK